MGAAGCHGSRADPSERRPAASGAVICRIPRIDGSVQSRRAPASPRLLAVRRDQGARGDRKAGRTRPERDGRCAGAPSTGDRIAARGCKRNRRFATDLHPRHAIIELSTSNLSRSHGLSEIAIISNGDYEGSNMPDLTLSDAEVVRRGREIYDSRIRASVEPVENGRFVAIDIETGDYDLADEAIDAIDRLRERGSNALVYIHRVGRAAAYRIGAKSGHGS